MKKPQREKSEADNTADLAYYGLDTMNRNHTFISEAVLAGGRYGSTPCRPCLDDFSRSSEKRADVDRSSRQRKTKKPAVDDRSDEVVAPIKLSFQKVEERKLEFRSAGEVKKGENRNEKHRFIDSSASVAPLSTEGGNGSKLVTTSHRDEEFIKLPQNEDDLTFQKIKEVKVELSDAVEVEEGENANFSDDKDSTRIFHNGNDLTFQNVKEVKFECSGVNEIKEGGKILEKTLSIDSVALVAPQPAADSGSKPSSTTRIDADIAWTPHDENDTNTPNLVEEAPTLPVSPLGDAVFAEEVNLGDACNGIVLDTPLTPATNLLSPLDDDSVAETENSISSKEDAKPCTELTPDDAAQPFLIQPMSQPLLFLQMWVQSTIGLVWFLLKLPLLILVLSVKVTALAAGLYAVLSVCLADDEVECGPWISHTQLYNKPGIC